MGRRSMARAVRALKSTERSRALRPEPRQSVPSLYRNAARGIDLGQQRPSAQPPSTSGAARRAASPRSRSLRSLLPDERRLQSAQAQIDRNIQPSKNFSGKIAPGIVERGAARPFLAPTDVFSFQEMCGDGGCPIASLSARGPTRPRLLGASVTKPDHLSDPEF